MANRDTNRIFDRTVVAVGESTDRNAWVLALFLLHLLVGCQGQVVTDSPPMVDAVKKTALSAETISRIQRFCGDCHPMPIPSTFPKANWVEEVRQGFDFYIESKRSDLEEPIRQDVVRYFQDAAPDKVLVPRAREMKQEASTVRFQRSAGIGHSDLSPATAQVLWNPIEKSIFFTDMSAGTFRVWKPSSIVLLENLGTHVDTEHVKTVAIGANICRVFQCDWDRDGLQDYLIGELGTFPVGDHDKGQVSLLLGNPDGSVEAVVLADKLGRVVEAKPFDYDEDGDTDVLVAEFGWRKTGGLKLLRNVGGTPRKPTLQLETINDRHGVLAVEVADLDGDSRLDFVVAYGQEFESVEVYFNLGKGRFEHKVIMQLPDPSYNSSSFQIVDLDNDGRLDVVHTCGDTMDALLPKPYHGLRWIRNLGMGQWETRELGLLVGALQSTVADFDNDGDLDIAAVGLFPKAYLDGLGAYDSICWWEQKVNLEFVRHSIERDHCAHAACSAGDVNGDGRVDLIVGEWLSDDRSGFHVFWNLPAQSDVSH